jgi:hypothetical protein
MAAGVSESDSPRAQAVRRTAGAATCLPGLRTHSPKGAAMPSRSRLAGFFGSALLIPCLLAAQGAGGGHQ